jgi:hypothetical protein
VKIPNAQQQEDLRTKLYEDLSSQGRRHRRRKMRGICVKCPNPVSGRSYCRDCSQKMRLYNMRSAVKKYPEEAIRVLTELGYNVVDFRRKA